LEPTVKRPSCTRFLTCASDVPIFFLNLVSSDTSLSKACELTQISGFPVWREEMRGLRKSYAWQVTEKVQLVYLSICLRKKRERLLGKIPVERGYVAEKGHGRRLRDASRHLLWTTMGGLRDWL
jgi:hypothetical protein